MKKNGKDASIVLMFDKNKNNWYGYDKRIAVKSGDNNCYCSEEVFDFDSVEEIEKLAFALADMLKKIKYD